MDLNEPSGRCPSNWEIPFERSHLGRSQLGDPIWEIPTGRSQLGDPIWEIPSERSQLGDSIWEIPTGRDPFQRSKQKDPIREIQFRDLTFEIILLAKSSLNLNVPWQHESHAHRNPCQCNPCPHVTHAHPNPMPTSNPCPHTTYAHTNPMPTLNPCPHTIHAHTQHAHSICF